ncbi:hypothetical protein JYU34_008410 [Plutella xylostella]|uniref:CAF1B/HIR1 beta-propeller domain-containing protein n=1 Tax=Plutella xylostella TaxID=51655 RepID=A0ABQ7QLV0_PLUXY|nr:hypothetical protein JYU34_008410 [Plutella xylostella]
MKYSIPEISWHNRDPVLSVDFQPVSSPNDPLRLATGGTDSHVLIWYLTQSESGSAHVEVAADLTRHQKAVNVVRWAPSGRLLASGDDEAIIFIWKQNAEKEPAPASLEQGDEQYKESWIILKTLRGHMEDVLDLSWSADSLHLASGSVDNKLLIWDVSRGRHTAILTDHKGFVQGVSWDPKGQLIATTSSDRVFRTFDVSNKKVTSRSSKAILPLPADHPLANTTLRLFHDDTLQTFYRRLQWSPDGLLVAVPAGRLEPEQGKLDVKPMNAVHVYTRYSLKVPACILPCDSAALVVRWSPRAYRLRGAGPPPAFPLQKRMLLAVATKGSVLVYDTQQRTPVALISNIHYTRLTDLTWSRDGRTLVASSTDGFCSVISFSEDELGEELTEEEEKALDAASAPEPMETDEPEATTAAPKPEPIKTKETKPTASNNTPKIDSFIKFKAPDSKSPKKAKIEKKVKTPVKIDVLEEVAMTSWSDNSSSEFVKPKETIESIVIEDSEDIKLVYEETEQNKSSESQSSDKTPENKSPESKKDEAGKPEGKMTESPKTSKAEGSKDSGNFFKQAKVTDVSESANKVVPSPKAPRRVSFVTLSSPKNSKRKL